MSATSLQIGVAEFRRRPGNRHHLRCEAPLAEIVTSASRVPDGALAQVDVVLEALSDGVTVHGTVSIPWEGSCRRCLESTSGVLVAEIDEVFKDGAEGDDDLLPLVEERIDLEPTVHDAVVVSLPLAPLCADDCAGPEPDAFPVGAAVDDLDESAAPAPDPRWAALDELRFDRDDSEQ